MLLMKRSAEHCTYAITRKKIGTTLSSARWRTLTSDATNADEISAVARKNGVDYLIDGEYVETPDGQAYHSFLMGRPIAGPDGSVYVTQSNACHSVRRVAPDGTISTVAGTGQIGYSGWRCLMGGNRIGLHPTGATQAGQHEDD